MATVSVVICSHSMRRWERLRSTLATIDDQSRPPDELILVVDGNPPLLDALQTLGAGKVYANELEAGVSGARNTGWSRASGELVVFLDDDAVPAADWLQRLVAPFEDPAVVASGGWLEPDGAVPSWYPKELYWVFGCSWEGLVGRRQLRNPIGASMAWRRETLQRLGGFSPLLGRNDHHRSEPRTLLDRFHLRPRTDHCDDTLLGILARRAPEAVIAHAEDAVAYHHVPAERATLGYLAVRAWGEGASKRRLRQLVGDDLADERSHAGRMARTLLGYSASPRRWPSAICLGLGLASTVAGYLYASVALASPDLPALPSGALPPSFPDPAPLPTDPTDT